jgi:hypothetical protein
MQPLTARRTRRILVILSIFGSALAITLASARSQTKTDTRPQFDVASVKFGTDCGRAPNDPGPRGPGISSPGRLEIHCATVEALIQGAYVGFANGVTFNRAELEIRGGRIGSAPPGMTSRRGRRVQHTWHRCLARCFRGFSKTVFSSRSIAIQSRETSTP